VLSLVQFSLTPGSYEEAVIVTFRVKVQVAYENFGKNYLYSQLLSVKPELSTTVGHGSV